MGTISKKVTLKEIANYAGVSIATASRVINSNDYVSIEKREKVESAIAELNFTPDHHARGLRGIKSRIVALMIPDILNVYYTNLAQKIEEGLRMRGYTMLLGITNDQTSLVLDYLEKFTRLDVDGIIFTPPPSIESSPYIRSLAQKGISIIEINRRREKDLFDGVEVDNFGAVIQALEHLSSLNHQRIAFVVGSTLTTTGSQRLEGYRYFMNKNGIEIHPELIKIGEFSREFGETATQEILKIQKSKKPTAIFPTSNRLLMGTMKVLKENQIKVPEDISIIAMDDTEWLESFEPSITTVDVAIEEMAELTVDLLLSQIEGNKPLEHPRTYTLSTNLKIRKSCKELQ